MSEAITPCLEETTMISYRLRFLFLVAPSVLSTTAKLRGQERPLPPSASAPDSARRAKVQTPPAPAQSPALEAVLRQAHLTLADVERRKRGTSRPLPAIVQQENAKLAARNARLRARPPAAPASPSLDELLAIVRKRPGGAQLLER